MVVVMVISCGGVDGDDQTCISGSEEGIVF